MLHKLAVLAIEALVVSRHERPGLLDCANTLCGGDGSLNKVRSYGPGRAQRRLSKRSVTEPVVNEKRCRISEVLDRFPGRRERSDVVGGVANEEQRVTMDGRGVSSLCSPQDDGAGEDLRRPVQTILSRPGTAIGLVAFERAGVCWDGQSAQSDATRRAGGHFRRTSEHDPAERRRRSV